MRSTDPAHPATSRWHAVGQAADEMAVAAGGSTGLISIVVPAYNAARTLERTLASALAQTYSNLEVIVVDDGSTDCTAAIATEVAARDPRLRLVSQPSNGGVAAARNLGLAHARGALIAPLDADDLWHSCFLERLAAALVAAGPRVGVVYALSRWIDRDDRVRRTLPVLSHRGDVHAALVACYFLGNASCTLIRRQCLEAVGGYDPSLRERDAQGCEDWKLYLEIAERWEFECVPEYLVGYRAGFGQMSANLARMLRSWRLVMEEVRRRHPELPKYLFRWSTGEVHRWLAAAAVGSGDVAAGLRLATCALLADPSGTLRLKVAGGALWRLVEGLGPRLSWAITSRLWIGAIRPGILFADASPKLPGDGWPHRWYPVRKAGRQVRRGAPGASVRSTDVIRCGHVLATPARPGRPLGRRAEAAGRPAAGAHGGAGGGEPAAP